MRFFYVPQVRNRCLGWIICNNWLNTLSLTPNESTTYNLAVFLNLFYIVADFVEFDTYRTALSNLVAIRQMWRKEI